MLFRAFCALGVLLFLLSLVVQYNDPDPLLWIAIYGVAMIASLLAALRRSLPWYATAAIALCAAVWGGWLWWGVSGRTSFAEMFGSIGMVNLAAEEGREAIGLGLVAVFMVVLTVARLREER